MAHGLVISRENSRHLRARVHVAASRPAGFRTFGDVRCCRVCHRRRGKGVSKSAACTGTRSRAQVHPRAYLNLWHTHRTTVATPAPRAAECCGSRKPWPCMVLHMHVQRSMKGDDRARGENCIPRTTVERHVGTAARWYVSMYYDLPVQ